MCRSKAYKRYGRWYNYHGKRIYNTRGYFRAVRQDRYGYCRNTYRYSYRKRYY